MDMFKKFIVEVAERDYKELVKTINNISFEEAFKKLNGFNLSFEPSLYQGKYDGCCVFFDFNFKSLNATIFRTEENGCELCETMYVWCDDYAKPIATISENGCGGIDFECFE